MIPLFKLYVPADLTGDGLLDVVRSGRMTSGEHATALEATIGEYIGNPRVVLTANHNFALLIALQLAGLRDGDEVLMSPMACLASNQAILHFGVTPVWVDIDPRTGTLDPSDLEGKISPRSKAILHYHWGGYPGYVAEINDIARENGLLVIDDAVEAFGADYRGRKMGALGTPITVFSLQTVRLPHSLEGGLLAFSSQEHYERAVRLRDFGIDRRTFRNRLGEIDPESDIAEPGFNAVMNELNAYVGRKVFDHFPGLLEKQRHNASRWELRLPPTATSLARPHETTPNYWIYSYLSDKSADDLVAWRGRGMYASRVHLRNDRYSCYRVPAALLSGVADFSIKQLSLPSGWWVRPEEIDSVTGAW